MRQRIRFAGAGSLCLATILVAACGKDGVVPEPRQADVVLTSSPPAAAVPRPAGLVEVDATFALVRGDGRAVPVPSLHAGGLALLDGSDTVRIARGEVPGGAYTAFRMVFTRASAEVDDGLVAGGGSITGTVRVAIAQGDSLVVERPFPAAATGDPLRVLVDLRGAEWLAAVNPGTRTVPAAAFSSAVVVGTW